MHEYSVTQHIINTSCEEAQKAGAARITEIRLVIGDLSSIIDESVQMYFDMISSGTLCEGAKLVFKRVAAEFYCNNCGKDFVKPSSGFACPVCGTLGRPTSKGREFYIESLEVD